MPEAHALAISGRVKGRVRGGEKQKCLNQIFIILASLHPPLLSWSWPPTHLQVMTLWMSGWEGVYINFQ